MSYEEEPQYYNIVERGDFSIKVEKCKNVEDLSDSFITKQDLYDNYYGQHGKHYNLAAIRDVCMTWAEKIQDNRICSTQEPMACKAMRFEVNSYFVDIAMRDSPYMVLSDRIVHIKRHAERQEELSDKKEKALEKELQRIKTLPYKRRQHLHYSDVCNLKHAIRHIFEIKYHVNIQDQSYKNTGPAFSLYKKTCNWKEVSDALKHQLPKKQHREDIKFAKMLWQDPQLALNIQN